MRGSHFKLKFAHIHVYKWEPDEGTAVSGLVHLIHGTAEHARRYEHAARFLTGRGLAVYASDLRGHGWSVDGEDSLGFFGEEGGWRGMLDELRKVTELARAEHPGLKLTLLGHSMGSFLARHYAIAFGGELDGLILIGTAHQSRFALRLGSLIARLEIRFKGIKYRSRLINRLSYRSFNRRFEPARTLQDWITRDEGEVDKYRADKLCGFIFTAGAYRDMFEGLLFITKPANIRRMRTDLPTLLLSGANDPVGGFGKTVKRAYRAFRSAGVADVRMKLYDGMRHEILNEIGREEVYGDIVEWLYGSVIKPSKC